MKPKHNNILVLASTFPINEKDTVPSFVKDLVISLKNYNPDTNLTVIAPSYGKRKPELHPQFNHLRYRYFIKRFENLTKKGLITYKTIILLNWFYHNHHDNQYHQNSRHFINYPIKSLRSRI